MPDFDRGRWAPSTRKAYRDNWREFEQWCYERIYQAIPAEPETIARYLIACQVRGLAVSSISQRLATIVAAHALEGHTVNVKGSAIRDAWAQVRRSGEPKKPKDALPLDDIKAIVRGIPANRLLERAVVLVGFASALRRSELSALDMQDLEITPEALVINVRRSKADKFGKGESVAILRSKSKFCAVAALEAYLAWLTLNRNTSSGPVFVNNRSARMTGETVAYIVKTWARHAGYDPALVAAHSLRRGCITTMFRGDAKIEDIGRHARQKTPAVTIGYVEKTRAVQNPALSALNL